MKNQRHQILFLVATISLTLMAVLIPAQSSVKIAKLPFAAPQPTPTPAGLDIQLSKTSVKLPCPSGGKATACDDDMTILVKVSHSLNIKNPKFTYTVSGGRVAGSGAEVKWDLTGVSEGYYTITAGISNESEVLMTYTKAITVEQCECVNPCNCMSSLSVSGPSAAVKVGETARFTANVSGGEFLTYSWTVDKGYITSGQGTPFIVVDTAGLAGESITATVEVIGDCEVCGSLSGSETAIVIALTTPLSRGNVIGTVRDSVTSRRLRGAKVELIFREFGAGTHVRTNASGKFEFLNHLANVEYKVRITLNGYKTRVIELTLEDGETEDLSIRLVKRN